LLLKRQALQLKSDPSTGGKYIANLQEIRVRSAEEAKRIIKVGQINRRVFGTVMNAESSRSHAIFTIRIIKVPKGAANVGLGLGVVLTMLKSCTVLRIQPPSKRQGYLSWTWLDQRGPRIHKLQVSVGWQHWLHALTRSRIGERLKEAGNINKSLMVLGQCMEVLRTNQRKLANVQSHGTGGTGGVGSGAPKLGIVPFRHSKLTELFQDFFVGEGRAVSTVSALGYLHADLV
jgi:kinesin family protein 20